MSTPTVLTTQARSGSGSRVARQERAAGNIPVIIYGHGQGNLERTVDAHALGLAFATTDQVFNLEIDGKNESCLVKEVQYDTFGQYVLHVDFARIDLSEQVSVEVALEFRGDPIGVAAGGTQIIHHPALAVNCRADSIPDTIVVEVSGLDMSESLHAGEIQLPEGVTLDEGQIAAGEQVVAVVPPRTNVAEDEESEEAAEGEEGEKKEEGEKADGDS